MKFTLNHNSSVPLYLQAEQNLRKMIEQPEYQEGKLLPNEVDIAKAWGISRNTLRQATNKLVYEGLLLRKKGVGTVVTHPVDSKAQNWMSFSQEMQSKGIKVVNYDLQLEWEIPRQEIRNFMAIDEGVEVLKMERLRGGEDGPFVFFVSHFHPWTNLTENDDFTRPLYDILEEDHSIVAHLSKEEITARAANSELAKKLRIEEGEPILVRKRFVFDPGRRAIEYNIGYYRADSFVYTLESQRT
ncbi:MAG: GntR family transcriptional regulator [Cyclobacteriaceae bacterium]